MPLTHNQKIKARKKKDRQRKNLKAKNINRNLPAIQFRLDILNPITEGGVTKIGDHWTEGVKYFRSIEAVKQHKAEVENGRILGHEILPGRIISLREGKVISEIAGSNLSFKGTAPDKIADGPKADPDVKGE